MWKAVELKDITYNLDNRRVPLNSSQRGEKESEQLYPYIGANNIMGYIDEFIFDEKILCVAEDGGSWGKGQRCAVIYNEKVWVNNHAHVLTAKDNLILEYLMYYLNYEDLNLYINGATRGKLTKSSLNSILIPLPPLEQQKKIAAILDAADELRQKDKALIAKYDELTQALFLDMFGDPFDKNNLGNKVYFETLTNRITYGFTKPMQHLEVGIPILTAKNIQNGFIDFERIHYADLKEFNELTGKSKPEKHDILITKDGSIGRTALFDVSFPVCINQSVALVKPNLKIVNPNYLVAYLISNTVQRKIEKMGKGGGLKHLQITELAKFPTILPSMELQNQFAERVKVIEEQKSIAQASAVKSEELFNSLLQKAFNGELV